MRKQSILLFMLMAFITFSSNTNAQTKEAKASKSSSSILTKKYDLSEVQKFDIHKMVDVEVIYGAENSVSVIGDANSQDLVAVENNQGTVTIYSRPSKNGKPGKYKVVIQTTQVDQFNVEKVSNFKMNISAANKKISIALKSVSRANIKANAQQLDLQANSCSTIILSGDAKVANYKLQSISTFNSKKLMANNVNLDANSCSSLDISILKNLSIKANSLASVRLYGDFETTSQEIKSIGSIRREKL